MLVSAVKELLSEYKSKSLSSLALLLKFVRMPVSILTIVASTVAIVYFIFSLAYSHEQGTPYQFRATGYLVEGIVMCVLFVMNATLYVRESRLRHLEVHDSAADIIAELEKLRMGGEHVWTRVCNCN